MDGIVSTHVLEMGGFFFLRWLWVTGSRADSLYRWWYSLTLLAVVLGDVYYGRISLRLAFSWGRGPVLSGWAWPALTARSP